MFEERPLACCHERCQVVVVWRNSRRHCSRSWEPDPRCSLYRLVSQPRWGSWHRLILAGVME